MGKNNKPLGAWRFFSFIDLPGVLTITKGEHIMNPTTEKLKKLIPNSISLPPDDPIYSEPPGILFTGPFRRPGKKPIKASKPEKER